MSNLLATLVSSASTLDTYSRMLETVQNNVSNESTPGYAKQRLNLYALPFDPLKGITGGVRAGKLTSARDEYSDQAVRQQTSGLGYQQQLVESLSRIEADFDISGNQGIPLALNDLLQAFSAWGATPDNQAVRQTVIQNATNLAQAFNQAAKNLSARARESEQQIGDTVVEVNQLVAEIQNYNRIAMQGNKDDAGLDARMHAALEELATLVDASATFQSDGTVTLVLNGETPLLVGDKQYMLSSSLYQPQDPLPVNPISPANARIQSWDGSDITAKTTGGQLGALLKLRNQVVPSFIGDAHQSGDLNVMAKQFADRVNQLLTSGNISDGPPPVPGVALFTYDSTNATASATTLSVDTSVTPDLLATISPGPPTISNGVPLALSAMAAPVLDADKVDGLSYSQYYGQLAGRVGTVLNDAKNSQDVQMSLLSQAKNLRQHYQGVSLDEEATILMQFQRAYQATSKFLTVLDQLTETTINILR